MGDEEESKEDIVELAENDRLELERLTQGGVAAVNKQVQQFRARAERDQMQIAHANSARAREKDEALKQSGQLKKSQNKKNLGPSSIKTIIRAANSREH